MVRAWYINSDPSAQRAEHCKCPSKFVTLEDLYRISGVEYFKVPPNYASDDVLNKINKSRGCTFEEESVCSKECLLNYEHLHAKKEIYFVLEGSAHVDVKAKNKEWVRIEVVPGDMIVIPSEIYHRFPLGSKNVVRAKRFLVEEPLRLADEMDFRKR